MEGPVPQLWWLLLAIGVVLLVALVARRRGRAGAGDADQGRDVEPDGSTPGASGPSEADVGAPEGDGPGPKDSGGAASPVPPGARGASESSAGRELVRREVARREVAHRGPGRPSSGPRATDAGSTRGPGGEGARGARGSGRTPPGGDPRSGGGAGDGRGPRSGGEPGATGASSAAGSRPSAPPAPSGRTALFGYGGPTPGGLRLPGPFAVVAIRTNGLTPMRNHVIELAVVAVDARGRVEGEPFVTVLEPPGGHAGPTFLHGLEPADLRFAPSFGDVARLLLARIEGRIVVTHQARLVEQFLAAEFLAAGLLVPTSPALDLTSLTRLTFATPNYRLRTLAAHLELRAPRGGAALDEARLVAAILPRLLARLGTGLTYPVPLTPILDIPRGAAQPAPRPRPVVPDTVEPWLDGLMTRLAAGATETNDPRVAAYLEALTDVVSRGRTVTEESAELAAMLARSGYPAGQIRTILERFLESLRQAAFEESRISPAHLRHLRAVAVSVGIPTYFDDLIPPPAPEAPRPGSGTFSRPVRKPPPVKAPPRLPRCGHCLGVGHWTANCPRLRGSGGRGAVGPVRPVRPIDPI